MLEEELNNEAKVNKGVEAKASDKAFFEPDALKNPAMSKLKREVTIMMDRQSKKEDEYNKKLQEETEKTQEVAFNRELDKNEAMKN